MRVILCLALVGLVNGLRRRSKEDGHATMRGDDLSPFPRVQKTDGGCECVSKCGPSMGSYYLCNWCKVHSECRNKSWAITRGNYGMCAYDNNPAWSSASSADKKDVLWREVEATQGQSQDLQNIIVTIDSAVKVSMRTPFDNSRDVMEEGRRKVIHEQGVVCGFELEVARDSPYTGLLSRGIVQGLLRMGSAAPPVGLPGFLPGVAFKFMRDGMRSANFVALRTTAPGGSPNFFEGELSNHVTPPRALLLLNKFIQASDCQSMVGLSDVCAYSQGGKEVRNVSFPFELRFEAPDEKAFAAEAKMYLPKLETIPVGTKLWDVYAYASPTASRARLGELRTTSKCTTTLFGDTKMHFRHQRMEEDFALRPEWVKDVDFPECVASTKDTSTWQCTSH